MKQFFRGGRELPQGQDYVCSIIQNNRFYDRLLRLRLLADPRNDERSVNRNDEMWRSDVYHIITIFCVLFSWSLVSPVFGQEAKGLNEVQPLMIGQRVPDEFWTKEHLFYVNGDTVRKTLEVYRGKLLVLGFWATWCSSCLKQQKDVESFLKEHAEKVNVVKVNSIQTKDTFAGIKKALANNVGKRNGIDHTNFVSIINDSYLFKNFPHHVYPHYVWINKDGVIQILTYRNLLDRRYQAPFVD